MENKELKYSKSKGLSQKEYLKKYLSSKTDDKKKKSKKLKAGSKT